MPEMLPARICIEVGHRATTGVGRRVPGIVSLLCFLFFPGLASPTHHRQRHPCQRDHHGCQCHDDRQRLSSPKSGTLCALLGVRLVPARQTTQRLWRIEWPPGRSGGGGIPYPQIEIRDVVTKGSAIRRRKVSPLADPKARELLREADPILARIIDAQPDFHPRAWLTELPPLDAFRTLVFQVIGQQLSVGATRTILSRLQQHFAGHLPTPAELLAADPQVIRASGLSARKGTTLRALAERFIDGRLSDEALSRMTDAEIEAVLTEVPGIGPWTAHGFLIVALDRPDVLLTGDLALRRVVERTYGFDHLPTEDEMTRVADRWRPYRSLAVSYLFASEFQKQT